MVPVQAPLLFYSVHSESGSNMIEMYKVYKMYLILEVLVCTCPLYIQNVSVQL